jgi:outer membrane autotransporter protein
VFVQHERLKPFGPGQTLGIMTLFLLAVVSLAEAQPFDQAIANALNLGVGNNCPGMAPVGNLDARICNNAGAPGASGGSTTSLSRESAPIEEERRVERKIGPINLYFSGEYERFDKDVTKFEPGYKTNTGRALIGADYSFGDRIVLGGAFKYTHDDGKFDSQASPAPGVSIPRGRFDTDSYGGLLHASFVPAPNSFVDTSFGYTRKSYFISRGVAVTGAGTDAVGTADGDTNGNEFKVEMNGGYNFSVQNFTVGPRVGLNYKRTEIDGFRERSRNIVELGGLSLPGTGLELVYNSQRENSLTSVLGMYGSIAISTGFGVLIPQTTLEYVHEFLDPQRKITFRFVDDLNRTAFRFQNDPPDRNYFNLGAGLVLQLAHGITPFINYRALVGYKEQRSHRVTAGLRVEF